MFGLSGRQFKRLMQIILNHADLFHKVILFGSRARGDDRAYSDIDLAVSYRQKNTVFHWVYQRIKLISIQKLKNGKDNL